MFKYIKEDIRSIMERDPSVKSVLEIILCYPGFHAMRAYRIGHFLYRHKRFTMARILSQMSRFLTGIEIHPGAVIGRRLFIDHGMGVVVGETAVIGDDVTIYQGVTLGGTGKDRGKRHPTICDNVTIGAGAKVLGPISVGSNSKIGAGAVVIRCIPANSTAIGIPAHVVKVEAPKRPFIDLNHSDIPDPVEDEIKTLEKRLEDLEKKII